MKTTNRYSKASFRKSGEKSFGAKPWERDSARGESVRREMHRATCGECSRSCEVPFKPTNGRKVLCSTCFQGGSDQNGSRSSSARPSSFSDRPSHRPESKYGDRPAYRSEPRFSDKPTYRSEPPYGNRGGGNYEEQFKILNAKLDTILQALR